MGKSKVLFIFILLMSLLFGCREVQTAHTSNARQIFSIKDYMKSEAVRLDAAKPKVHKELELNSEIERKEIVIDNWSKELEIFSVLDINKPSLIESYKVDTIMNGNKITKITHRSKVEKEVKVKVLDVEFDIDGKPTSLYIEKEIDSPITTATEKLQYNVKKGYQIESTTESFDKKKNTVKVNVSF